MAGSAYLGIASLEDLGMAGSAYTGITAIAGLLVSIPSNSGFSGLKYM